MVFPFFTGLPGDVSTNTTHWFGTSKEQIADRMEGAMAIIGSLMPSYVSRSAHINIYDLEDPEPRVPYVRAVTLDASSTAAGLPGEVAICASWAAGATPGVPVQSLRNRIFIGPLNTNQSTVSTGSTFPRVKLEAQQGLCDIIEAWATPHELSQLIVYGPRHNVEYPAVRGWVDDEFDTQRRRGVAASARTSWP